MAATNGTILGPYYGSSLLNAFTEPAGGPSLDLLQIVDEGDNVLINVTNAGVVHNPAVNPTNGTLIGVYYSSIASGTTAQIFAAAFPQNSQNNANLDIVQVVNLGGNTSYYLNYQGVATGS